MNTFDFLTLAWFAGWSVVTCFAFGWDKWRAQSSGRRIPEITLVILAALGG